MKSIWIARGKDGSLIAYKEKPEWDTGMNCWIMEGGIPWGLRILPQSWLPEVTWENSPIELVIKEKED